jgi:hypothetical protein
MGSMGSYSTILVMVYKYSVYVSLLTTTVVGFLLRVRACALRAPVFFGLSNTENGALSVYYEELSI